jgi:large subunit ribosomal protein L13
LLKLEASLYLEREGGDMPRFPLPKSLWKKQRTYMARKEDAGIIFERRWYVVDAADQPLGRLASKIARILQGKHKPTYTPHFDVGDYVIVVNAAKIKLTGNKREEKIYYRHSGYIGNLKEIRYQELLTRNPELPLKLAVRRMLPKNELGRRMLRKLKVYPGPDHPHRAQVPLPLPLCAPNGGGGHLGLGQRAAGVTSAVFPATLFAGIPFASVPEVDVAHHRVRPTKLCWAPRREG